MRSGSAEEPHDSEHREGAPGQSAQHPKQKGKKKSSFWVELPILIVTALVLTVLIQAFLARVYVIPSQSMEQTLHGCTGCNNDRVLVDKVSYRFASPEPGDVVDCGNSGTTARLLLGVLAGQPFTTVLTGDASLRRRPMGRVTEPLTRMGATVLGRADSSRLPLALRGRRPLRALRYATPVASAQVKSAVLLAGLWADGPVTVTEPAPSRDHSERMLRGFGAGVTIEEYAQTFIQRIEHTRKHTTHADYRKILDRDILPVFRGLDLQDITREKVKDLAMASLKKGQSPKTVQNIIRCLSSLLSHAIEDELVTVNPALKPGRFLPRITKRHKITPLTREEVALLLDTAKTKSSKYRPLAKQFFCTIGTASGGSSTPRSPRATMTPSLTSRISSRLSIACGFSSFAITCSSSPPHSCRSSRRPTMSLLRRMNDAAT